MKLKYLCLCAALAALAAACSNSDKSDNTAQDSQSEQIEAAADTLLADTTSAPVVQEEAATEAKAETVEAAKEEPKAEAQAADNGLDAEVDKIIGIIQQHIDAVNELAEEGFPSSSSTAFRVLGNLPNYDSRLKKIKKKLSPEQKARIDAAEKKLDRAIDKWDDVSIIQ